MARGAIGAGDAGRASVSRGLHPRPSTHPRLWAGMLRVRTRTTPLKPAWTAGRGVIRLGADCGPSLLGPVRLRRTPPRFPGCGTPAQALAVPCGFPPGGPTGVAPPVEPSAGRRPANRGGVRRLRRLPPGGACAPHRNRHAGACLNPARGLRLAAGRGHPFGVVGRIFSAAPPRRPLPTLRPRVRGARRAPGMSDAALGRLHPPAKRAGPVPMLDPLPRSRAPIGPRHGEAAPPSIRRSAKDGPLGVPPHPKYSARLGRAPLWAAPRCCVCAAMKPGGFKPPKLRGR